MKILVTAATFNELQLINRTGNITVANTGVGIASTAYKLAKLLNHKYDLAINIGVAGSFSEKLNVGDVVTVYAETFGDFGVAGKDGFRTCFEENIVDANMFPFVNGFLMSDSAETIAKNLSIPHVKGLTNNTVSGEEKLIEHMKNKFAPDIETMEGAAFFYVCLAEHVPFVEIRSISNIVEPRDKGKWNIPLALTNLSKKVNSYLAKL
jgi:futalosine hydrolase